MPLKHGDGNPIPAEESTVQPVPAAAERHRTAGKTHNIIWLYDENLFAPPFVRAYEGVGERCVLCIAIDFGRSLLEAQPTLDQPS